MTHRETPRIVGEIDRITGKRATIYTPPEDLVEPINELSRGVLLMDQAQLAALPARCVVRAADGTIAARFNDEFGVVFGDDRPFPWSALRVPALVLWVDGDTLALPGQPSFEATQ